MPGQHKAYHDKNRWTCCIQDWDSNLPLMEHESDKLRTAVTTNTALNTNIPSRRFHESVVLPWLRHLYPSAPSSSSLRHHMAAPGRQCNQLVFLRYPICFSATLLPISICFLACLSPSRNCFNDPPGLS